MSTTADDGRPPARRVARSADFQPDLAFFTRVGGKIGSRRLVNYLSDIFFPVIIYSCVNLEHHTYRKLISEMLGCFGDVFCDRVRGFWADFEGK